MARVSREAGGGGEGGTCITAPRGPELTDHGIRWLVQLLNGTATGELRNEVTRRDRGPGEGQWEGKTGIPEGGAC